MRALAIVVIGAGGLVGCGADDRCPDRDVEVVAEREVDVAHRGPDLGDADVVAAGEIAGAEQGFVLQVRNTTSVVERVRLTLDGRTALDVDLPVEQMCWGGHGPVFTVAYPLPPGPVTAVLDLQGSASRTDLDIPEGGTVFGVVQVQSERSWGDMAISDDLPVWG